MRLIPMAFSQAEPRALSPAHRQHCTGHGVDGGSMRCTQGGIMVVYPGIW